MRWRRPLPTDDHFLSASNPLATVDQPELFFDTSKF